MKKLKLIISLFFTFFIFSIGIAQSDSQSDFFHKNRFNAGFVAGFNASELSGGDGFGSYLGLNVGIFGIMDLNDKMHLSMELIWSQNGEYVRPEFFPNEDYSQIKLNFIEVPIQFNYRLRQNGGKSNNFGWLRAGVAYAHLLNYSIFKEEIDVTEQVLFEGENAYLANFGGLFFLNKHWGIDVKMSLPVQARGLAPTFAFRGIYLF